jgi:hypothetical protein
MRFVAIKGVEQQASRGLEGARELLMKQHTQLRNCVRGQLAEFGILAAQGRRMPPLPKTLCATGPSIHDVRTVFRGHLTTCSPVCPMDTRLPK